jgi:CHAD domain-containing protein
LGAVRDREVLLDRLKARAASLPPNDVRSAASLLHILEEDIDSLRKKLIAELDSTRYIDLLERLVEAAHSPATLPDADQPASTVLPPLATSPWRRLRSAVKQLPEQPVVGASAAAFARACAKLQTILGEHQDSVTAQAWLRSIRFSGRRAFVAGQLIAMEHMAAEEARAKWPKVWKSLDRKRLHQWMP